MAAIRKGSNGEYAFQLLDFESVSSFVFKEIRVFFVICVLFIRNLFYLSLIDEYDS